MKTIKRVITDHVKTDAEVEVLASKQTCPDGSARAQSSDEIWLASIFEDFKSIDVDSFDRRLRADLAFWKEGQLDGFPVNLSFFSIVRETYNLQLFLNKFLYR